VRELPAPDPLLASGSATLIILISGGIVTVVAAARLLPEMRSGGELDGQRQRATDEQIHPA
jgi:hypothetical protein